ncbi:MAG TPA: alpha/beta fold hydrolase [Thermoanaerobaculia bacterium]|nr:alpha/beta fold hydrolase [Thermoanaerobaculia bacterium]
MWRWIAAALLAASLTGCVGLRSYRTEPPYGPIEKFKDKDEHDVSVGFVELDDHGLYWTDEQLPASMRMIEDAAEPNGAIVVVFTHGWMNNARYPDDSNYDLNHFKNDVLAVMSQHETEAARREGRARRNVVGVYVAWRGMSLKGKLFALSFYDRLDAALRVADTQATVTLRSLIAKTRENRQSQIMVIGHSFGGLITERALGPVLITEAMRVRTGTLAGALLRDAPDLVILVNPATNATRALGDVWTLKESPELVPPRFSLFRRRQETLTRAPLIVSLTSATDTATGIAFPIAEYLDGITHAFRSWKGTPMDGVFPSERSVYAHTMGHLPAIWSHDVTFTQLPSARTDAAREPAAPCREGESSAEVCFIVGKDMFAMTPRNPRFNDTHYWIMQIPKTIVNGHSDVWNPVWVNMLIGMMESLGPERAAARP